jgi:hypothetical protein
MAVQAVATFDNNFEVSVIKNRCSHTVVNQVYLKLQL